MTDTPRTDAAFQWDSYGTKFVEASFARQLERELAEARKDAERYRAIREAHSLLKLYRYDDPQDPCSGDWHYKPTPEAVDEFADLLIANTSSPPEKG